MLCLDTIRQEFARFLSEDPGGRWRMDAALAHVVQLAYQQGIKDGQAGVPEWCAPFMTSTGGSVWSGAE